MNVEMTFFGECHPANFTSTEFPFGVCKEVPFETSFSRELLVAHPTGVSSVNGEVFHKTLCSEVFVAHPTWVFFFSCVEEIDVEMTHFDRIFITNYI